MNVRDIMSSRPITVSGSDSLDELMRTMEHNQVRHLPVMDGEKVLGVLSDRDLLAATGWRSEEVRDGTETAGELLLAPPICCSPDDSVVMVAVDLTSRQIGCMPVIEDDKLVGIVTEMDLLRAYVKLARTDAGSKNLSDPVEKLMTTGLSTLSPHSTLEEALELEHARAVRHLPVVEKSHLVGIISDRDLCQALGAELPPETPISKIMSADPLTIGPHEPVSQGAMYLLEGKISALPVSDHGKLMGILALSDLLHHCIENLRQPDSYPQPS